MFPFFFFLLTFLFFFFLHWFDICINNICLLSFYIPSVECIEVSLLISPNTSKESFNRKLSTLEAMRIKKSRWIFYCLHIYDLSKNIFACIVRMEPPAPLQKNNTDSFTLKAKNNMFAKSVFYSTLSKFLFSNIIRVLFKKRHASKILKFFVISKLEQLLYFILFCSDFLRMNKLI